MPRESGASISTAISPSSTAMPGPARTTAPAGRSRGDDGLDAVPPAQRDERAARLPPSELPPLLQRPARLADRDLDAAGRPGVARPGAHPRSRVAGHRGGRPVPARDGPRARRRRGRRRAPEATGPARDTDRDDGPGGDPRGPRAD